MGRLMKLLDQCRQVMRVRHLSYRTEQAYVYWIEKYIRFHGIRHPNAMGAAEVEQYLTHLAAARHVAASTQNQALNALVFLYRDVLRVDLGRFDALRAIRHRRDDRRTGKVAAVDQCLGPGITQHLNGPLRHG
jgi:site-specific recombinase XerD